MSFSALTAALVIILFAGVSSGLTGFGFALVSVPPLLLIFDPPTVVAINFILGLVTTAVVLMDSWKEVKVRTVLYLLPWAFAGLFVGAELLQLLSRSHIQLIAGVVVVGFALLLSRTAPLPGIKSKWATAAAGTSSGVLSTSIGMGGPPVVLLFSARGLAKHSFRATITAYFLITGALGLALLMAQGLVNGTHLWLALILTPAALLGKAAGTVFLKKVSSENFRRITLALVIFTGLLGAITAILALF